MSGNDWDSVVTHLHMAAASYDDNAETVRQMAANLETYEPAQALVTLRGARQLAKVHEVNAAKARQHAADLCQWLTQTS